jgi:hypothetical protein
MSVINITLISYEYLLPDILDLGIDIKQIVIEFHHRMFVNGAKLTKNAINLLAKRGFSLFAYSESVEEFSFINMKYYQKYK